MSSYNLLREKSSQTVSHRQALDQRIRKVAADNPDLPVELLAERFGVGLWRIQLALGVRRRAGAK